MPPPPHRHHSPRVRPHQLQRPVCHQRACLGPDRAPVGRRDHRTRLRAHIVGVIRLHNRQRPVAVLPQGATHPPAHRSASAREDAVQLTDPHLDVAGALGGQQDRLPPRVVKERQHKHVPAVQLHLPHGPCRPVDKLGLAGVHGICLLLRVGVVKDKVGHRPLLLVVVHAAVIRDLVLDHVEHKPPLLPPPPEHAPPALFVQPAADLGRDHGEVGPLDHVVADLADLLRHVEVHLLAMRLSHPRVGPEINHHHRHVVQRVVRESGSHQVLRCLLRIAALVADLDRLLVVDHVPQPVRGDDDVLVSLGDLA
mmetsp:Transcript_28792/g.56261  ORF Transcript_28792/g.56261 Transcript_28792/m.56261 type:complete len:310 (-) Transcript_28792:776-1705(-)